MEQRPRLTLNCPDLLPDLLRDGVDGFTAIEVGHYLSVEKVQSLRQRLNGFPLHFHPARIGLAWGTIPLLRQYLACTQSEFISLHFTPLPSIYYIMERFFGVPLPVVNERFWVDRFVRRVQLVQRQFDLPVTLENLPMLTPGKHLFKTDPAVIRSVLEKTGCGLLLDLGHVRVAADLRGEDVYDYLGRLPLERTVQIHVHGSRRRADGRMYDAHEPMEEEDYALLEWTLRRTQPRYVTLEYYRKLQPLEEQIVRLKAILNASVE